MKSLKYIILFIAEATTSFYTPLAVETIIHSMKYISVVNSGFMNQLKLFSNKFTQLVEIRCYNLSVFPMEQRTNSITLLWYKNREFTAGMNR